MIIHLQAHINFRIYILTYLSQYQAHKRTQAQWDEIVDRVFDLEDQYDNLTNIDRIYR